MKKGYDISKWNYRTFNARTAKEAGIDFVIIRAGFGQNNIDPYAQKYYDACQSVGIQCGFYWFSYATSIRAAMTEAEYLLEFIKDKKVEYPLVYDFEGDSLQGKPRNKNLINQMGDVFCRTCEEDGYYAMIYTNKDYLNNVWDEERKKKYGMWVAHYGEKKDLPAIAQIWQSSNTPIDLNYDVKNIGALIAKKGLNHLG